MSGKFFLSLFALTTADNTICSVWFEQCQQVTRGRAHAQSGQNPPLRTFIFRTARLKSFPVQVIFAYDGPERPALKRGQKVTMKKTHWMTKPTQRILDTFDIQWFTVCTVHLVLMFVLATDSSPQAKGEAEAELAAMNGAGMIDAVMTDDSDVFAFGGRLVLRKYVFSVEWGTSCQLTNHKLVVVRFHC